jgi:hypothetical protein
LRLALPSLGKCLLIRGFSAWRGDGDSGALHVRLLCWQRRKQYSCVGGTLLTHRKQPPRSLVSDERQYTG